MMKSKLLVVTALMLGLSTAYGVNNQWNNGAGDGMWTNAANWNKDRVPNVASNDVAIGREAEPTAAVLLNTTPVTQPQQVWWGANNGLGNTMTLTVQDAVLVSGTIRIGYERTAWGDAPGDVKLVINNSSLTLNAASLSVVKNDSAAGDGTKGAVELNSGTLLGTLTAFIGDSSNTTGTVTLNGGQLVFTNNNFNVGFEGTGVLTVNSATNHNLKNLKLGVNAGSSGTVNLFGGSLRIDGLSAENPGSARINISEGLVLWNGAHSGKFHTLSTNGTIVATGGRTDDSSLVAQYTTGTGSYTNAAYIIKWGRDSAGANDTALWAFDSSGGGTPSEIGDIVIDALAGTNGVTLTWGTTNGFDYDVQFKLDLVNDTNWLDYATGIPGTGGDITITADVIQAESFYRVIIE
jgi:T5SS/PEP-CTERM-associated repeat protein